MGRKSSKNEILINYCLIKYDLFCNQFIRETGCVPACTTDTFSVSVDHSVPVESDESSSAVLYFNAPRPIFTVKTDYPVRIVYNNKRL